MIKVNRFFLPYIVLLVVIGFNGELAISFLVVVLHESVHYLSAIVLGFSGFDMKILPIGAMLQLSDLDDATLKEDLIISLSGPLSNIVMALIAYVVNIYLGNYYLDIFLKSNIALGIFNLLPAFPLDGGRILRVILSMRTIYKRANELTIKVSVAIGFLLFICFIFLLFMNIFDYNIGIISVFVIVSSYKEKERIVYIIMGDIVRKKSKFMKRKYIENKSISIFIKGDLIGVLSLVDKNKYNIFTVLDEKMKVIDTIYEEEILEALKEFGNITIEEFVELREKDEI